MVSRHGMSEEEAPASAYLRAVSKSVAGFVYTERGKSTKNTVNSIAPWHIHNNTYLHVHTHAQTHTHNGHTALNLQVYNYRYGTFMNICTNIISSKLKTLFCGIFSVWSLKKKAKAIAPFLVRAVIPLVKKWLYDSRSASSHWFRDTCILSVL